MADSKYTLPNIFWGRYLMNCWLVRIQILCSGSLGMYNDLITFWE